MSTTGRHVWIINHYSDVPSKDGGSGRHLDLARHLPASGWDASLVVASTTYPLGKQAMPGRRLRLLTHERGVPTLWIRTNAYGSSTPLRLLGMMVFAFMLLLPGMTKGLRKPDVIIGSTVHPFAAWAGMRLARRYKVPFIYEIRDVWPETLYEVGAMSPRHPLARLFRRMAMTMCRRASLVLSPLPHIDVYLSENGLADKPFLWVSNGFDGPVEDPEPTLPERDTFTFMYTGSHNAADVLDGLIKAFDGACSARPDLDLRLRFVGDGNSRPELMALAASLPSASRITFDGWIPKPEVLARAREADCLTGTLMNSPLYRYGISLNKLYQYMYAYRPVVFASSAPNNPVREADSGIVVEGDNQQALTEAMIAMASAPLEQRRTWARNGYRHLQEHYKPSILAEKLADGLDQAVR
ncbi:MAG: glycosyltransferase family 4 protein [Propionibacteriaceae bacterium]|nr:glycosyltransferase family 4 protein [Propionibacteriaceae bacterium]